MAVINRNVKFMAFYVIKYELNVKFSESIFLVAF